MPTCVNCKSLLLIFLHHTGVVEVQHTSPDGVVSFSYTGHAAITTMAIRSSTITTIIPEEETKTKQNTFNSPKASAPQTPLCDGHMFLILLREENRCFLLILWQQRKMCKSSLTLHQSTSPSGPENITAFITATTLNTKKFHTQRQVEFVSS